MNELQYAIEDYIHFIQVERQLSENTLASYRRDLNNYVQFLQEHEALTDFKKVERMTIVRHLEQLRLQGKTSRTVARHISSIRSFHQFLLREKRAETDPSVHLEMPQIEQKLPNVLSIEEIEALLDAPNRSKPQGVRDIA
ncbi:MAG: site-specific integrase, partial [Lysinibacillus sp.]